MVDGLMKRVSAMTYLPTVRKFQSTDGMNFTRPNRSRKGTSLGYRIGEDQSAGITRSWTAKRCIHFYSAARSIAVVRTPERHSHFVPTADSCTAANGARHQGVYSIFSPSFLISDA